MKKRIIAVAAICLVLIMGIGLIFYCRSLPLLKLKNVMKELEEETYSYSVTVDAENLPFQYLDKNVQLSVDGKKGEEVLLASVSYQDEEYLKVYADQKKDVVFNLNPLLENVMSKMEEQSGFPISLLGSFMGDVNVSLSQIEEVTGQNLSVFSNQGTPFAILGQLADGQDASQDFEITYLKEPEKEQALLGEDAYYYEISIPENETEMILGIPKGKSDKKLSCYTQADGVTWKMTGDYKISDVDEIDMPQATVSDKTIDFLKKVYDFWKDNRQQTEDVI